MWRIVKIMRLIEILVSILALAAVETCLGEKETHGNRKMNAKPIASFRFTDMKRPFSKATASVKRRISVNTSKAATNCHRLDYTHYLNERDSL